VTTLPYRRAGGFDATPNTNTLDVSPADVPPAITAPSTSLYSVDENATAAIATFAASLAMTGALLGHAK
jgi:hypothetical protein